MQEKTRELLKKFEEDNETYVSATEALTCEGVYARVTRSPSAGTSHPHHGIKYVSGPNEDGNVLVLRDPFVSDAYSAESWGPMTTIDDFVKKKHSPESLLTRMRQTMDRRRVAGPAAAELFP